MARVRLLLPLLLLLAARVPAAPSIDHEPPPTVHIPTCYTLRNRSRVPTLWIRLPPRPPGPVLRRRTTWVWK